ncbi:MAG: lytic murein transglycosylase [Caldimicrobium sp.]|nr:lytic murein transglycosylase [Caldimicrobium sp.]MCX7873674.1 lytic murein transglycosylase [Caldimicrobium sp.]MDW8094640.1 lytic murein transglycosylase [Caldimicrobium sp.]
MFYSLALGLIFFLVSLQGPERSPEAPLEAPFPQIQSSQRHCLTNLSEEVRSFAEKLIKRLQGDLKERVPKEYIENLFCSPNLSYSPEVMLKSLTWKEAKLPYHQFLELERLRRAQQFLEENIEFLSSLENRFKVDKEVIVAIFLVETDLGRKTGHHSVLNTFFSLALSGEEDLFKRYIVDNPEISLENETIRRRWERRARWAYEELLYFLEISYRNNWDPLSIKGSVFGAFGFPQFVPKSYVNYGYDWDGDGKVDLYNIPDALASIANYLHKEGYRREGDYVHKKRVIMKYNISEPYAETVLKIADFLKKNFSPFPHGQRRD